MLNILPFSITWHLFAVFNFLAPWCHRVPGNHPTGGSALQALVFPWCGWAVRAEFIATLASLELPPSFSHFSIRGLGGIHQLLRFGENNYTESVPFSCRCRNMLTTALGVTRLILSLMKKNLAQHFKAWKKWNLPLQSNVPNFRRKVGNPGLTWVISAPHHPLLQRKMCCSSPGSSGVGCSRFLCLKFSLFSEAEKQ